MITKYIITEYAKNHKLLLIAYAIVVLIAFPIDAMAMSYIYGKIFNQFNTKKRDLKVIRNFFISAIIVWIVVRLSRYLKTYLNAKIIPSFYRYSREVLFDHVISKYKVNYSEPRMGDILTTFTEIPYNIYSLSNRMLNEHIPIAFALLGIIGYTFYINPYFGAIMLAGFLISIYITYKMSDKCIRANRLEHDHYKVMNEDIQDKFSNLFNIYTSNTDEYEKLKNYINGEKLENLTIDSINCSGSLKMYITIISTILFAIVFYFIYTMYENRTLATTLLITSTIMLTRYFNYFSSFFAGLGYTFHIIGSLQADDKFLYEVKDINRTNNESPQQKRKNFVIKNGNIKFSNVSFKYDGSNKVILDNVSFSIQPNKVSSIFGRSGMGKTTVVKLMMGFYKLHGGNIYIDGQNTNSVDLELLRSNISFVNQKVDLFNDTVINNIKYGNNATIAQIQRYIEQNRILPVFKNLQNGLNTVVGVNGANLSRGQRQTVLLLRAMMRNTKIIIFDEPTSALDPKTKSTIMGLIKRLSRGKTVLIITHDRDVLKYTDYKYRLDDGKLIQI